MNLPVLNFLIDLQKDIEVFKGFLKSADFFDNEIYLEKGFFEPYPKLKEIIKDEEGDEFPKKEVFNFVKKIYKKERKVGERVDKIKKGWLKREDYFYKKTAKIFRGHGWPEGKYFAYATVWSIYPRYLKTKEFTFPYSTNNNDALRVIMHEMLHFIFYDYAIKKHPERFKNLDTNRGFFWDLSEIFNAVILYTPTFIELHGKKELSSDSIDPEHEKHLEYFKNLWEKNQDIDEWLIQGYKYWKNL